MTGRRLREWGEKRRRRKGQSRAESGRREGEVGSGGTGVDGRVVEYAEERWSASSDRRDGKENRRTGDSAVNCCSVLQLDRHRLVVELHLRVEVSASADGQAGSRARGRAYQEPETQETSKERQKEEVSGGTLGGRCTHCWPAPLTLSSLEKEGDKMASPPNRSPDSLRPALDSPQLPSTRVLTTTPAYYACMDGRGGVDEL